MSGVLAGLLGIGGGSGVIISIDGQSISAWSSDGPVTASYQLNTNGNVESVTVTVGTLFLETWLEPTSADRGLYSARAQVVGGTSPNIGNSLNTWLGLGSTLSWGLSTDIAGVALFCKLLVQIREEASGVVLGEATVFLNAEMLI